MSIGTFQKILGSANLSRDNLSREIGRVVPTFPGARGVAAKMWASGPVLESWRALAAAIGRSAHRAVRRIMSYPVM